MKEVTFPTLFKAAISESCVVTTRGFEGRAPVPEGNRGLSENRWWF